MKKQTAVEWLVEQIEGNILWNDKAREMLNQAKAIEKEQIKNAYVKGQSDCEIFTMESESEQYYNETFTEQPKQ
jgi:hypothetical protein